MRLPLALAAAAALIAAPASAVQIVIDYTYDTGFFHPSNPNGVAARETVEAAADFYSEMLDDTFSAIATPEPYVGQASTQTWTWSVNFENPSGSGSITIPNPTIAEDEYRVYVGAEPIPGSTIAVGGPGGYDASTSTNGPGYFPDELAEVNAISDAFFSSLETRGEPVGDFTSWGGAISFDAGVNWNYSLTGTPSFGQSDLFATALHELAHAVGFGTSMEFSTLRSGSFFIGPNATAANGGTSPRLDATGGHWQEGLQSTVFGVGTPQEVLMDPQGVTGARALLTELDAAALADIGWEVVEPATPTLAGDYNGDGRVDAADYVVWRNSLGSGQVVGSLAEWGANYGATAASAAGASVPEPAAALLLAAALGPLARRRL